MRGRRGVLVEMLLGGGVDDVGLTTRIIKLVQKVKNRTFQTSFFLPFYLSFIQNLDFFYLFNLHLFKMFIHKVSISNRYLLYLSFPKRCSHVAMVLKDFSIEYNLP